MMLYNNFGHCAVLHYASTRLLGGLCKGSLENLATSVPVDFQFMTRPYCIKGKRLHTTSIVGLI
jgi:hypothetical protein